ASAYAAGASGLPCAVLRGYLGTDLMSRTRLAPMTCPFTGEQLVAVPALRPDVAIVHAQEADRRGNVQLWGIPGVQKEAVVAARRLHGASSVFIGVGRPSTAAILARGVHNPELVLVYESGTVGAKPVRVPLSIGDGELAETADFIVSVPEMFNYWIGAGRI